MSEYTVKQFAVKEKVHQQTVRQWIRKGAVDVRRTPGGQIRIVEPHDQSRAVFMNLQTSARM